MIISFHGNGHTMALLVHLTSQRYFRGSTQMIIIWYQIDAYNLRSEVGSLVFQNSLFEVHKLKFAEKLLSEEIFSLVIQKNINHGYLY